MAGVMWPDADWDDDAIGAKPEKVEPRPIDAVGRAALVFGLGAYVPVVLSGFAGLNILGFLLLAGCFDWPILRMIEALLYVGLPINAMGLAASSIALAIIRLHGQDRAWPYARPAFWINATTTAAGLAAWVALGGP